MKFQFRELEDYFGSLLRRLICQFGDETSALSIIWEFWNRIQPYIQHVFDHLVHLLDSLGFYGNRFVFDAIDLACSQTDPDGVWMWEPSSDELVSRMACSLRSTASSISPLAQSLFNAHSIQNQRRSSASSDSSRTLLVWSFSVIQRMIR